MAVAHQAIQHQTQLEQLAGLVVAAHIHIQRRTLLLPPAALEILRLSAPRKGQMVEQDQRLRQITVQAVVVERLP